MASPRLVSLPALIRLDIGLWAKIPSILQEHHLSQGPVLLVSGPGLTAELAQDLLQRLQASGLSAFHITVQKSDIHAVEKVRSQVRETRPRLFLAIGGGKPIDVAKYTAYLENLPFVAIPTVLSSDGIASPVAVIQGIAKTHSVGAVMPIGVLVDLEIVQRAPIRYLKAGVGDLIANLSAVQDWRLAEAHGKEPVDELAATLAETGAQTFLYAASPSLQDFETLRLLSRGLILGGIAMGLVGSSRPCSGSEHLISHALDHLGIGTGLHGEQVALGTLMALSFQDHPLSSRVRTLFETLGLPTHPRALGVSVDMLSRALEVAPQMRPERYTVLDTRPMHQWHQTLYTLFS